VTVTNQADADERIPLLLDTHAAHRFVSVEPMLGPVELHPNYPSAGITGLDLVIVGGKTPGKPLHEQGCTDELCADCPDYDEDCGLIALRSLRDQCEAAGTPLHYKHGGTNPPLDGVVYDWRPS
jgi:protein gp37